LHTVLTAQFRNDLYGFTTGQEIAPEWRPADFLRLRSSYSFLNMNLSKAAGTPLAVGGTPAAVAGSSPRHEVTAQASFDGGKRTQIDLIYRYVSAAPAVNGPAYSMGDVRVARKFGRNVEFSVVGRNLFQPSHVEYEGDPGGPVAIRRTVYATLSWTK
jgi:iron complex outermembrane receptor protein